MNQKEFLISKDKMGISWRYEGKKITLHKTGIDQVLSSMKSKVVIILDNNPTKNLFIYSLNGNLKFKIDAPKGYVFSYLTEFPESQIAVVCNSEEKQDGWYDWHFLIMPETGELKRGSPSY